MTVATLAARCIKQRGNAVGAAVNTTTSKCVVDQEMSTTSKDLVSEWK